MERGGESKGEEECLEKKKPTGERTVDRTKGDTPAEKKKNEKMFVRVSKVNETGTRENQSGGGRTRVNWWEKNGGEKGWRRRVRKKTAVREITENASGFLILQRPPQGERPN